MSNDQILLSKEQILSADDREYKIIHIEKWGGDVRIATMQACDRDAFEATMIPEKGKDKVKQLANFRARFVSQCIVNDEGNRLFSPADMVQLGRKSAAILSTLFDACRELNGMTDEDIEELGKE